MQYDFKSTLDSGCSGIGSLEIILKIYFTLT
jgi:hypothetical protein